VKVPLRAGRGGAGEFRAAVHLGITIPVRRNGSGECPSVLPAGDAPEL